MFDCLPPENELRLSEELNLSKFLLTAYPEGAAELAETFDLKNYFFLSEAEILDLVSCVT